MDSDDKEDAPGRDGSPVGPPAGERAQSGPSVARAPSFPVCEGCKDLQQLLLEYPLEPILDPSNNKDWSLVVKKEHLIHLYQYLALWVQRQCPCLFRDGQNVDRFSTLLHCVTSLSVQHLKTLGPLLEDGKWTPEEVERLLQFMAKVFMLQFPLYSGPKQVGLRNEEVSTAEATQLAVFCDVHDSADFPITLLRMVTLFCKSGGLQGMAKTFQLKPTVLNPSIAHSLISILCNIKLWLNYRAMLQLFVPVRANALQYMCELSDQELREQPSRHMADFLWSSVKENIDTPISFDKDGLDLAFKYFCSTTLTMRLAGMNQINSQINLFNDLCNTESVVEVENVGLKLAGWLLQNKIIEHIFGPNLHVEVIKLSHIILNFLAVEGKITNEHVNVIWQAAQLKHCSKQVNDVLLPLIKNLEACPVLHLYELIKELPIKDHTEQTIQLAQVLQKFIWTSGGTFNHLLQEANALSNAAAVASAQSAALQQQQQKGKKAPPAKEKEKFYLSSSEDESQKKNPADDDKNKVASDEENMEEDEDDDDDDDLNEYSDDDDDDDDDDDEDDDEEDEEQSSDEDTKAQEHQKKIRHSAIQKHLKESVGKKNVVSPPNSAQAMKKKSVMMVEKEVKEEEKLSPKVKKEVVKEKDKNVEMQLKETKKEEDLVAKEEEDEEESEPPPLKKVQRTKEQQSVSSGKRTKGLPVKGVKRHRNVRSSDSESQEIESEKEKKKIEESKKEEQDTSDNEAGAGGVNNKKRRLSSSGPAGVAVHPKTWWNPMDSTVRGQDCASSSSVPPWQEATEAERGLPLTQNTAMAELANLVNAQNPSPVLGMRPATEFHDMRPFLRNMNIAAAAAQRELMEAEAASGLSGDNESVSSRLSNKSDKVSDQTVETKKHLVVLWHYKSKAQW